MSPELGSTFSLSLVPTMMTVNGGFSALSPVSLFIKVNVLRSFFFFLRFMYPKMQYKKQ